MKGISPIIASVLLIAITMSIAVVLAAYVTTYTREATQSIPSACIGGALFFRTGSPTYNTTDCVIKANVEGQFVTLNTFKVDYESGGSISSGHVASGTAELAPGDAGTVTFDVGSGTCTDITSVRITTSCFNVKTEWAEPTIVA